MIAARPSPPASGRCLRLERILCERVIVVVREEGAQGDEESADHDVSIPALHCPGDHFLLAFEGAPVVACYSSRKKKMSTSVSTADTASEPRHPRRLEKKTNTTPPTRRG